MVDFNPYIQIQPVQQVREIRNLGEAQATGQVVAPAFSLGKALGELAPSLAEASRQNVKEEEQKRRDEQTAQIQLIAEQETEAKLGELIQQRVKTGELPPGYSPYMMDLLERQAGRRAFRDYRREADQALRAFNDPDYAGDPDEVLANIQAEVLGRYGAADQGAKFLAEFVTLRGDVRDAFTSNAVKTRSSARQKQATEGFRDDVAIALSEFGTDPEALNGQLANLLQEAVGSSLFVGKPKGELTDIMAAVIKGEVERLTDLENIDEARTLIDTLRVLNPRSRRLNGTPGDDETTDATQPNSFAYDHGSLIRSLETQVEQKEMAIDRRDGGAVGSQRASVIAGYMAKELRANSEYWDWLESLPPNASEFDVRKATAEWMQERGLELVRGGAFGGDMNEQVQSLLLAEVDGTTTFERIKDARAEEFRASGDFRGIQSMDPTISDSAVRNAIRSTATDYGVSESKIQSIITMVLNDRRMQQQAALNPAQEQFEKKQYNELLVEFEGQVDGLGLNPEEYEAQAARFIDRFGKLGDQYAARFGSYYREQLEKRRVVGDRRVDRVRAALVRDSVDAMNEVEGHLRTLFANSGQDITKLPPNIDAELNAFRADFESRLYRAISEAAYKADEDSVVSDIEEVREEFRLEARSSAQRRADSLFRTLASDRTVSAAGRAGTQAITGVKVTEFGWWDNAEVTEYLAPVTQAREGRTVDTSWAELWKSDSAEFDAEVNVSRGIVRSVTKGDRGLEVIEGQIVPGETAFFRNDLELAEAQQAAQLLQLDDIVHLYAPTKPDWKGREITISPNGARLDRRGIAVPHNLLNPAKVPYLSRAALDDEVTERFIEDHERLTESGDFAGAETALQDWLRGKSPGAEEYKLLPEKYQTRPSTIWAMQEKFYAAWEATRNN